ncbi:MAG: phospholipase D family protein [Alphaproteobacteria bacterium]|nr:phospholipase D family protein [Alphaproteobacteria bacterium]
MLPTRFPRLVLPLLCVLLCLGNCAAKPIDAREYPRTETYAIAPDTDTTFRRYIAPLVAKNGGQSGFELITTGKYAFLSRMALIHYAEKTLDIQYYILQDDKTGLAILHEVMAAADRGVRVRILVDDMRLKDVYHAMAVMDSHPNIEIRGFNPITVEKQSLISRINTWLGDFDRYTKRMHNKALIADNQLAIVGGRNLGDQYFDVSGDFAFNDLDVITAGPITAEISRSFDKYWNSPQAFPRAALTLPEAKPEDVAELKEQMVASRKELAESTIGEDLRKNEILSMLREGDGLFTFAPSRFTVDSPLKIRQDSDDTESPPFEALVELVEKSDHELLAVTPYFVPREDGVAWLREAMARGLKVKVLTNSLAATDVSMVHSGYAKYRREMLEMGVELYEFKQIPGVRTRSNLFKSSSRSSLHSKVYVVDRRFVVLGSFNLDPRSVELNTELAVVIDSPKIAAKIVQMFEETIGPKASYKVSLKDVDGIAESKEMVWEAKDKDGNPEVFVTDPKPGAWRSISTWFFGKFDLDDQL